MSQFRVLSLRVLVSLFSCLTPSLQIEEAQTTTWTGPWEGLFTVPNELPADQHQHFVQTWLSQLEHGSIRLTASAGITRNKDKMTTFNSAQLAVSVGCLV